MANNYFKRYTAGQTAPVSGQYGLFDSFGNYFRQITMVKGKTFPPPPRHGLSYILMDATDHASGR